MTSSVQTQTQAQPTPEDYISPFLVKFTVPGWIHIPELSLHAHPAHADIIKQVRSELSDLRFTGKEHGTRSLRVQGCKGPLCRKAQRDWAAQYRRDKAKAAGTAFVPRPQFGFLKEIDPLLAELYRLQYVLK